MIIQELIKALELDANGDWDASHQIVQQYFTTEACWIHAYLHRKEGDLWNAEYWYTRANRNKPNQSIEKEWEVIYNHMNGMTL